MPGLEGCIVSSQNAKLFPVVAVVAWPHYRLINIKVEVKVYFEGLAQGPYLPTVAKQGSPPVESSSDEGRQRSTYSSTVQGEIKGMRSISDLYFWRKEGRMPLLLERQLQVWSALCELPPREYGVDQEEG